MTKGTLEAIRKIRACTTLAELRALWDNDLGRSGWHRSVRKTYIVKLKALKLGPNLSGK
jgi:hypothetical protein